MRGCRRVSVASLLGRLLLGALLLGGPAPNDSRLSVAVRGSDFSRRR